MSGLLEVHFWILGEGNVGAQVVVQAVIGLVALQQLNDLASSQLLCVFLGHLDHQLQVLLHVGLKQLLQQNYTSSDPGPHASRKKSACRTTCLMTVQSVTSDSQGLMVQSWSAENKP